MFPMTCFYFCNFFTFSELCRLVVNPSLRNQTETKAKTADNEVTHWVSVSLLTCAMTQHRPVSLYRRWLRRRRPAILQKEFANNDAKDQHRDQVGYRRLRCKGWCINWHCWRSHAWRLLRWRCWWVRWRGTGNLAQSDAFLLHMHFSTSTSSQLRHHIRQNDIKWN